MSVQESKLDPNKDYQTLAQIRTIIQPQSYDEQKLFDRPLIQTLAISKILQQAVDNININFQINSDSKYYKINNPNMIGYTALHFAVEKNNSKIVEMLLKFGADVTIKNNNNDTVLHQANQFTLENLDDYYWGNRAITEESRNSLVNVLLFSHTFSSDIRNPLNNYGISHFHIACLMNNIKAVQLFLNNGVSINQAVNSDSPIVPGYTPLHFAVRFVSIETLKILIEEGADISLNDAKKMNPLHLLIKRNIKIIDYIRQKEKEEQNDLKQNFETNKKMIKLLIEKRSKNFQVTDEIGFSIFHAICTLQDVALLENICEEVSDLNHSIDKESPFWTGYTALHFAAHFDVEMVQFLVSKGADIMVQDSQGVTPLDIILQKCDFSDLKLIINSQLQWKNILFSDNKTKLIDLILSMQTADELESFLSKVPDINMFVPFSSSLWPGYTPLRLAVVLCDFKNYFTSCEDTYGNNEYMNYKSEDENKSSLNKIQVCLKLGADVTAQDVHVAFHKKRMDIVDQLFKKQYKIYQSVDSEGLSLLHMAIAVTQKLTLAYAYESKSRENDEIEYARCIALLSNQADTSITHKSKFIAFYNYPLNSEYPKIFYTNVGSTPLHISVQAGNTALTEKLLASGFDVNSKDIDGFTPIHHLLTLTHKNFFGRELHELLFSRNPRDCVSNCGLTYLHVACYVKNKEALKKLLDSGADVNAIIVPSSSMDVDELPELQLLIKHQRSVDRAIGLAYRRHNINSLASINHYANCTPLHFAVDTKYGDINYEIVDILLQRGANMLAKELDGSVLLYKILAGKDDQLKRVFIRELERNGEWQKLVEEDSGITMLHLACELLYPGAVERLLKSGGNVNGRCFSNSPIWPGCTPLHILVMSSQRQEFWLIDQLLQETICPIAKMLLDHGAEITIKNAYCKTPLHQSIQKVTCIRTNDREHNLTNILLKYQKDFNNNPTDDGGISHLHIACMCNDITSVKSFLELGANVDQAVDYHSDNYGGYTPLHFAVIHEFEEITHLLLQYRANVNSVSCRMETPLHLAFTLNPQCGTQSMIKYVEILLNAGAKINERNIWGKTPLEKHLESMHVRSHFNSVNEEIVNIITKYAFCVNVFYCEGDEGFIGSILRNKKSYGTVLQNPVFQAVLKAPDINGPDFLGRSIIHNVVCDKSNAEGLTTADYISIIESLTKLGFDIINHRDERGFTPLHAATKIKNLSAIESLLMLGADVNIGGPTVKVAYAYCVGYNVLCGNEVNWPIYRTFRRHFNKLSRFNLHIHPSNKKIFRDRFEDYNFNRGENKRHETQVINEGNRLKNAKIEPYSITLYDFLSETGVVAGFPFMLGAKKEAITKFFREKGEYLRQNFPELTGILYFQYRKALEREALIHRAFVSLNVLIDFELPFLCSENIFQFLTNIELKRLVTTEKLRNPTNSS